MFTKYVIIIINTQFIPGMHVSADKGIDPKKSVVEHIEPSTAIAPSKKSFNCRWFVLVLCLTITHTNKNKQTILNTCKIKDTSTIVPDKEDIIINNMIIYFPSRKSNTIQQILYKTIIIQPKISTVNLHFFAELDSRQRFLLSENHGNIICSINAVVNTAVQKLATTKEEVTYVNEFISAAMQLFSTFRPQKIFKTSSIKYDTTRPISRYRLNLLLVVFHAFFLRRTVRYTESTSMSRVGAAPIFTLRYIVSGHSHEFCS